MHLNSGARLLRQHPELFTIEGSLCRFFVQIDLATALWLDTAETCYVITPEFGDLDTVAVSQTPEHQDELDMIEIHLVSINGRVHNASRTYDPYKPSLTDTSSTGAGDGAVKSHCRYLLLESLNAWKHSLISFVARQRGIVSASDRLRIDIMHLNEVYLSLMIAQTFSAVQQLSASYNDLLAHHDTILEFAKGLLRPVNLLNERARCASFMEDAYPLHGALHLFQFPVGVIQPLFYTAVHAPTRSLQFCAVELLEVSPWREGAWDSGVMAAIAKSRLGARLS